MTNVKKDQPHQRTWGVIECRHNYRYAALSMRPCHCPLPRISISDMGVVDSISAGRLLILDFWTHAFTSRSGSPTLGPVLAAIERKGAKLTAANSRCREMGALHCEGIARGQRASGQLCVPGDPAGLDTLYELKHEMCVFGRLPDGVWTGCNIGRATQRWLLMAMPSLRFTRSTAGFAGGWQDEGAYTTNKGGVGYVTGACETVALMDSMAVLLVVLQFARRWVSWGPGQARLRFRMAGNLMPYARCFRLFFVLKSACRA